MPDLKPCPFCGGEAKLIVHNWDHDYDTFTIECSRCCGCMDFNAYEDIIPHLIDLWNQRVRS